jgi:site-specific DNA-methyltransferase (adenine-specific)
MSLPHRIAIRMMDGGYKQQNCIVWRKTNPKPSSIKNRLQNSYEFIFWFTKSKDYYFDSNSIRHPYKQQNGLKDVRAPRHFSLDGNNSFGTPIFQNPLGRIPSDFTDIIETSKVSYGIGKKLGLEIENNAAYPPQICVNPIISTSREDDLVLDPFMGSGTTGEVSLRLKRKFCGYELSPPFCKLSKVRLQTINGIKD